MGIRTLLVVVVLVPRFASAQPPPSSQPEELRSPSIALTLSIGTTLASGAFFAAGARKDNPALLGTGAVLFVIGPTTGHLYAMNWFNGGFAMRVAGAGIAGYGVSKVSFLSSSDDDDGAGGLIILGGTLYAVGMIYEIATAPGAAREYNRDNQPKVMVAPLVRDTGGGLALSGSF